VQFRMQMISLYHAGYATLFAMSRSKNFIMQNFLIQAAKLPVPTAG
jgi:hypothetical protein